MHVNNILFRRYKNDRKPTKYRMTKQKKETETRYQNFFKKFLTKFQNNLDETMFNQINKSYKSLKRELNK